jgi:acetyl esterase/lipase
MEKGDIEFLYNPRPDLPNEYLANMKPIKYKSRDGLTIHGYLTTPKNIKPKNLPVIINPHGGPWARDFWGYNPEAQFFANRGYACLQVNFRSSTGYGKAFFNAGKREWGEKIQDDMTDGVKWLIKEGIADPEKVAIYGGSFGGYSTLCGLAFTPDLYNCGVDYVGVCNLITLLKSIPPYWETARKFFNEQIGDPDNPEDVERMKRQSPLFSADKIKKPLLVVQGGNDPRCKMPESQQIVIAMRDLGRDVEYMVADDEGHGFAGMENRVALRVAMEKFFAKHLGGRYQEDVPENIQARLDEMMVPVETVVLTKPEGDVEAAKTAPLPAVNTANLKPAKMKYTGKAAVQGQEIDLEVAIDLSKAKRDDKDVWRIIGEQSSMMGTAIDTFDIDFNTLLPVYRGVKQTGVTVQVNYSEDAIDGMIVAQGQEMPLKSELEAPVYGSDTALDLVIASLPLKEGYKTSFRTFDLLSQAVKVMTLEVTGVEEITVPAGTYKTFKVELKNMDGEPGGGTVFLNTEGDHCVIRSVMQLPPMMGGGTVTSELESME